MRMSLGETAIAANLAEIGQLARFFAGAGSAAALPRCTDPDDQKFIELAVAAGALALVSKDRAVLKLSRLCAPVFRIMTPAEAVHWLDTLDLSL